MLTLVGKKALNHAICLWIEIQVTGFVHYISFYHSMIDGASCYCYHFRDPNPVYEFKGMIDLVRPGVKSKIRKIEES